MVGTRPRLLLGKMGPQPESQAQILRPAGGQVGGRAPLAAPQTCVRATGTCGLRRGRPFDLRLTGRVGEEGEDFGNTEGP